MVQSVCIAEVILRLCHSMGLCCIIVVKYAMYSAGKVASRPDPLALYVESPQTGSSEIAVLLQEQPSPVWCRVPDRAFIFSGMEEII